MDKWILIVTSQCYPLERAWLYTQSKMFFAARRYASAVCAVVCLSVRLSVTSRYCIVKARRTEMVFGKGAFFLTYLTLCYMEIRVFPKITVFSSVTLPQTLDSWQVDGEVNRTRRRSSLWITRTTVERVVGMRNVYYTLVDCNHLTPLLRLVLDFVVSLGLHYDSMQQLPKLWLTDRVARSLCGIPELRALNSRGPIY